VAAVLAVLAPLVPAVEAPLAPSPAAAAELPSPPPAPDLPACDWTTFDTSGGCQPPDEGGDSGGGGVTARTYDEITFTFVPAGITVGEVVGCGSAGCTYWALQWDVGEQVVSGCGGFDTTCTVRVQPGPQGDSGEDWRFTEVRLLQGPFPTGSRAAIAYWVVPDLYPVVVEPAWPDGSQASTGGASLYAHRPGTDPAPSECRGLDFTAVGWFPDRVEAPCYGFAGRFGQWWESYLPVGPWELVAFDAPPAHLSEPTGWERRVVDVAYDDLSTTVARQQRPRLDVSVVTGPGGRLAVGDQRDLVVRLKASDPTGRGQAVGELRDVRLTTAAVDDPTRVAVTAPSVPTDGVTLGVEQAVDVTVPIEALAGPGTELRLVAEGVDDLGRTVTASTSIGIDVEGGRAQLDAEVTVERLDGTPVDALSVDDDARVRVAVRNDGDVDLTDVTRSVDVDPSGVVEVLPDGPVAGVTVAPGARTELAVAPLRAVGNGTATVTVDVSGVDSGTGGSLGTTVELDVTVGCPASEGGTADGTCPLVVDVNGDEDDLDTTDGRCDSDTAPDDQCTLRAAVEEANARDGSDTITFDLESGDPTIGLTRALPAITDAVTVDGADADGAGSTAQVDGGGAGFDLFTVEGADTVFRSLTLTRTSGFGLRVSDAEATEVTDVFLVDLGTLGGPGAVPPLDPSSPLPPVDQGGGGIRVASGALTATRIVATTSDGATRTPVGIAAYDDGGLGSVVVDGSKLDRTTVGVMVVRQGDGDTTVHQVEALDSDVGVALARGSATVDGLVTGGTLGLVGVETDLTARSIDVRDSAGGVFVSDSRLDLSGLQASGAGTALVVVEPHDGSRVASADVSSRVGLVVTGGSLDVEGSAFRSRVGAYTLNTGLQVEGSRLGVGDGVVGLLSIGGSVELHDSQLAAGGYGAWVWNADRLVADRVAMDAAGSPAQPTAGLFAVAVPTVEVTATTVDNARNGLVVLAAEDPPAATADGPTFADVDDEANQAGDAGGARPNPISVPPPRATTTELTVTGSAFRHGRGAGVLLVGSVTGRVGAAADDPNPQASGNTLADDSQTGVFVGGGHVSVRGNTFVGNGYEDGALEDGRAVTMADIVLGVPTPQVPDPYVVANDALDADTGSNGLQNHPVLSSVTNTSEGALVLGQVSSTPGVPLAVDLYRSASCHRSGYGPLEAPLASTTVVPGPDGTASLELHLGQALAGGDGLAAIATGPDGTSAPSPCLRSASPSSLRSPAPEGSRRLDVDPPPGLELGDTVVVDPGGPTEERGVFSAVGSIVLDRPLQHAHEAGQLVIEALAGDTDVAPWCDPAAASGDEDHTLTGLARCSDDSPSALAYALAPGRGPAHGAVTVGADGSWSYAPEADWWGDDGFTVEARDGAGAVASQRVSVSVQPVNDPPACADALLTVDAGASATVPVSCHDADGDALVVELVAPPAVGSATISGSVLTYTAASTPGTVEVAVQARDESSTSAPATVRITVRPVTTPTGLQLTVDAAVVVPAGRRTPAAVAATGRFRTAPGAAVHCGDPVTFVLGPLTETIPAGAMRTVLGQCVYVRPLRGGGFLTGAVLDLRAGRWTVAGSGQSPRFASLPSPTAVRLSIGDDVGSTTVAFRKRFGVWLA
jgi:VCBS repeat-containing protein